MIESLKIIMEHACDTCPYSYMYDDCTIDSCEINVAYRELLEVLEEFSYED